MNTLAFQIVRNLTVILLCARSLSMKSRVLKSLAISFAVFTISSVALAEVHTVPLDIRTRFSASNCIEIRDYYRDAEVLEKPYIYKAKSFTVGDREDLDRSFIAWCKEVGDKSSDRFKLVASPGLVWPGGCSFPINGVESAGGLSLSRGNRQLSSFRRIEGGGPVRGGTVTAFVISSEIDGLVTEFICRDRRWLRRSSD